MIFGLTSNSKLFIQSVHLNKTGHVLFDQYSTEQSIIRSSIDPLYFRALFPNHLSNIVNTYQTDSLSIIAYARIDNRLELAKLLQLNTYQINKITCSQLIGYAYQKYGRKCVNYLVGDWAFAIWDTKEQILFLARDRIGNSSLYYHQGKDFFVFSTYLQQLLSLDIVEKKLNPNAFLQELQTIKGDTQTFYKDIYQIPCGHTLTIRENESLLENYWLPNKIKKINYNREEEYVEHFFELFNEAIKCRIGNEKMGIALSSGLDSTSIAVLLNNLIPKKKTLEAFTWYPHKVDQILAKGAIPNEVPIAKKFTQSLERINFNQITVPEKNFIAHKRLLLSIFGEPRLTNLHFMGILEAAYQKDIKTLFTGNLGNYSISYRGNINNYYSHLLNNLFNTSSLAQLQKIKLQANMSWGKVLLKLATNSIVGHSFQKKRMQKLKKKPYFKNGILKDTTVQQKISMYHSNTPALEKIRKANSYPVSNLLSIMQNSTIGSSKAFFKYYDIEECAPAADSRLLEYCLGLPQELFIKNGVEKYIFKKAFSDLLPDYILFAKKRGRQMTNAISKCLAEKAEITSLFESFKKSPLANYWLDIDLLKQNLVLLETASSRNDNLSYVYFLNISKGILIGMFLQNFEDGRY